MNYLGYRFALVGNPNSGKTTLFNEITGSTQYVGNWPGVTIEKKEGKARKHKEDIKIIDLPGIYSLSPYSAEEIIARDYIIDEKPDVLINIIDATNIERNLYLTTQVIELGLPVVAVLNIMDEVEAKGDKINIPSLEKSLGVPIVATCASKGKGVDEVIKCALAAVDKKTPKTEIFDASIEKNISDIEAVLQTSKYALSKNWLALKLIENDEHILKNVALTSDASKLISERRATLEKEYDNDIETIIADNRYRFISTIVAKSVTKKKQNSNLTLSDKIDKIVTNRILAIPLFLAVMFLVFEITFGALGSLTVDLVDVIINGYFAQTVSSGLIAAGAALWLHDLIVSGIIGGLGSMLIFVPQIMILFFFISILEDSGYMARAAFIMDRLFRKLGLSGKSFIPMFMGFGCSAPAVMATRTLENEKDRRLTIILTPFMSCGARLPVYALFTAAFFAQNQGLVIFSIYVLGIVVAILSGILLKNTLLKGEAAPFVMELPPYRFPTYKGISIHMWDRGKAFIKKAGTVIFAAAVVIWFLQSFDFALNLVESPADSIFGSIGKAIAPIFAPVGFGDWRSAVAILTGFIAKEVVVATMGILYGLGEVGEDSIELATALRTAFTPLSAYAFMAFTLLYLPCIAAFAAMKREMNSWKWTLIALGYQTGIAWLVAFVIYQAGKLFGIGI